MAEHVGRPGPGGRRGARAAAVLLALTAITTVAAWAPETTAHRSAASWIRSEPGDFVGAEACAPCHRDEYDAWSTSTHGTAGGPPSTSTVIAPFDGTPIRFRDAEVVPAVDEGGRYAFTVRRPGRPDERLTVDGVIGKGHMLGGGTQGFVSTFPDGTRRFLPFDFSAALGRWFCNTGWIAGWWVPSGGHADLRPDRGWVPVTPDMKLTDCGDWPPIRVLGTDQRAANCQQCHGSQITLAFDTVAHRYRSTATSLRINCESCHGPGREHIARARSRTLGSPSGGGDAAAILSPDRLGRAGSLGVCLQCHALKRHLEAAFLSGDSLAASYSLGLPLLGTDRPLLPDGKVRTFAYQANHLFSACWFRGGMTCVDCHDPHGQGYRDVAGIPLSSPLDDGQCLGCHASKAADPTAHTFHARASEGSRCVSCHLPYRQQPGIGDAVPYGRSDHTISIPRPGIDDAEGVPSACALCHADRSAEELASTTRRWYGALAPRPRLVERVTAARGAEADRLPVDLRPEELVDVEEAKRIPMAQVAALNELFLRYVRPDLATERVGGVDTALVGRLEELARGASGGPGDEPGTVVGVAADMEGVALALLHLGWGDVPEVRAFLDARSADLHVDPGRVRLRWARALQLMGDEWRARGHMSWALRTFTRAQEVRPDDASILLDLASAYTSLGRYEEAVPYYVRAVRLDRTQSVALVNLGLTLEAMGREDQAEGAYRQAVQVDPAEALAHMNLGNIELRRGNVSEAADSYREALRRDPSLARAGFYLAVALVRMNDLGGARDALLGAREFAPDDDDIAQLLGRVQEALKGR